MNLTTPEKIWKLQMALHVKAKESPTFRFYALYDKIYRRDILEFAYRCCKSNGGVSGVDGQDFADIEQYGRGRWLGELAAELKDKRYRPQAVRRVYIPKANGKQRPLGIPTIRDRVVQMAALLVLQPIFEADLQPEQYAYRTGRNALDAVRAVHSLLQAGHTEVVDADLRGYFDSIPHHELMKSVARRISDKHILRLIKMWLKAAVEETDQRGHRHRSTRNKDKGRGTPQGASISPLLSSIYMRRFVLGWKTLGYEKRLDAHIVNYADDFVICCRRTAQQAEAAMRKMMERLKLQVNETKTRICTVPAEAIEFLGYTIGRCYSAKTGKSYIGTRPSRKSISNICREISEVTSRCWTWKGRVEMVNQLNRMLNGWANYFCLGPVSRAYRAVDAHSRYRLRQWLCSKQKVPSRGTSRYPDEYLYDVLGLTRLEVRTHNFPWAKR